MFSHDEIWLAIDRLAAHHNYSASGLARKAGLDPTTFNKSKRVSADGKPRWPSTESIAKILTVTGANMSELLSLVDDDGDGEDSMDKAKTLPILPLDEAGTPGRFDHQGHPAGDGWDAILFDTAPGTLALQVSDGSMEPHYTKGDILVIAPGAEMKRGDRVIVKTADGPLIVRKLERRTAGNAELQPFDASRPAETLSAKQIAWMARIIWVSQ